MSSTPASQSPDHGSVVPHPSNFDLRNHDFVTAEGATLTPAALPHFIGEHPTASLSWLANADTTALMRIGNCSRAEIVAAQRLARAELKKAELLAVYHGGAVP